MATVITNMASAVPYIGSDLVQFLWGGLNTEDPLKKKFLIYAGKSSKLNSRKINNLNNTWINKGLCSLYVIHKFFNPFNFNIIRQSAGIGIRHYSQIPQRLNLENLNYARLSGFVEGDGWFSISKKGKYLTYEFGIELDIRDTDLIYQIQKDLLGIGVINFRNDKTNTLKKSKTIIFRVRNWPSGSN